MVFPPSDKYGFVDRKIAKTRPYNFVKRVTRIEPSKRKLSAIFLYTDDENAFFEKMNNEHCC